MFYIVMVNGCEPDLILMYKKKGGSKLHIQEKGRLMPRRTVHGNGVIEF